MTKKPIELPDTKAKSAEEKLEELVKKGSIRSYEIVNEGVCEESVYKGKARLYKDGFEAVSAGACEVDVYGFLHVTKRGILVSYFLKESD